MIQNGQFLLNVLSAKLLEFVRPVDHSNNGSMGISVMAIDFEPSAAAKAITLAESNAERPFTVLMAAA